MPRVIVFNMVSLDGYITDRHGEMAWAHRDDAEWRAFAADNAKGDGMLLFGRKTYELMVKYWPTPMARQDDPGVAEGMNRMPKLVFSRSLAAADWANTRVSPRLVEEVRELKAGSGPDMVILGSASIVAQLATARLVDEVQMALIPIVLGGGRTMFEGVDPPLGLTLQQTRTFANGNVFLRYAAAG